MTPDPKVKATRKGAKFPKPKVVVSGTPMPSHSRNIKIQGEWISSDDALSRKRKYSVYTTQRRTENFLFAIITPIAIVCVIVGLIIVFQYCNTPCNFTENTTEEEIIICQRALDGVQCSFDTTLCSDVCLFGFERDEYSCPISCNCATQGLFESDINFNPNSIQPIITAYITEEDNTFHFTNKYSSVTIHQLIWDGEIINGRPRVPYVFSADIFDRPSARIAIGKALNDFSRRTCIDFVPRQNQPDFVEFITKKSGCSSFVGRLGGRQTLTVGRTCERVGNILHELVHAVGFWHEQSRPDRDHHVTIRLDNVKPSRRHNFQIRGRNTVRNLQSSYDGTSIMHYDGYAFSQNKNPTILNLTTNAVIKAQRKGLTSEDLKEINTLYLCNLDTTVFERQLADHWSNWGQWGGCSSSCGRGHLYRIRDCLDAVNVVVYSGRCEGSNFDAQSCQFPPCEQGKWGPWSSCTHSCGKGQKIRESCCRPMAKYEQVQCTVQACTTSTDVGTWLSWGQWGSCSHTCGNGWRRRKRDCVDGDSRVLPVRDCAWKLPMETVFEPCNTERCGLQDPNAGFWHEWDPWSTCSSTCGVGIQMRHRECIGNQPNKGGCAGDDDDMQICEWTVACPAEGKYKTREIYLQFTNPEEHVTIPNGHYPESTSELIGTNWGPWTSWSLCSASCGQGVQRRERQCYAYVNKDYVVTDTCLGDNIGRTKEEQSQTCMVKACGARRLQIAIKSSSVPGLRGGASPKWSQWSPWQLCTKSCGMGMTWRKRDCLMGRIGGKGCESKFHDVNTCNTMPCYSSMEWGEWSEWSVCSKWCYGTRRRYRKRMCDEDECTSLPSPAVEYCNTACTITSEIREQYLSQFYGSSVVDKFARTWSQWAAWGHCTKSCNSGVTWRKRECMYGRVGMKGCEDSAHDISTCNTHPCELPKFSWTSWSSWSRCTSWCHGKRTRSRRRKCIQLPHCDSAPVLEVEDCNMECVDGSSGGSDSDRLRVSSTWSSWSAWQDCNLSCGSGRRWRRRKCLFGRVGSSGCEDSSYDIQFCNTQTCSLPDEGWGEWSSWSACSGSCGGSRSRKRSFACDECPDSLQRSEESATEDCNTTCAAELSTGTEDRKPEYRIEAMWSRWSPWGPCTRFCGSGVRWRRRRCVYGVVGQSGCEDSAINVSPCNSIPCNSSYFRMSPWSNWTSCTKSCLGRKWHARRYECVSTQHCPSLPSNHVQNVTQDCNTACSTHLRNRTSGSNPGNPLGLPPQWSGWSLWMECSKSCDGGVRWRKRDCMFGKIGHEGCEDSIYDIGNCNTPSCASDPTAWDQSTVFCRQELQVLDFNGDGLSDLVCVHKQDMTSVVPGYSQPNAMTVALNNGDTTFKVKEIPFRSELFNVECGNPFTENAENYTENASNMDVIFQRHRWTSGEQLKSRGFHSWYNRKYSYRRANRGLCGEDSKSDFVRRQMVSFLDGGIHVFCFDNNGRLRKLFMNLTLDDGVN